MTGWISGFVGESAAPAVTLLFFGIVIIAVLVVLAWIARRVAGGTFVAGGHGRRQRLAVMDATAVDSRRRLVLVRRDDTEHLLLIGGNADVVVEQNIRLTDRIGTGEDRQAPVVREQSAAKSESRPAPPRSQPPEAPAVPDKKSGIAAKTATVAAPAAAAALAAGSEPASAPRSPGTKSSEPEPPPPVSKDLPAKSAEAWDRRKMVPEDAPEPAEASIPPEPEQRTADAGADEPAGGIEAALLGELEDTLELAPETPHSVPGKFTSPSGDESEEQTRSAHVETPHREKPAESQTARPQDSGTLEDEMERLLRDLSTGTKR